MAHNFTKSYEPIVGPNIHHFLPTKQIKVIP